MVVEDVVPIMEKVDSVLFMIPTSPIQILNHFMKGIPDMRSLNKLPHLRHQESNLKEPTVLILATGYVGRNFNHESGSDHYL